MVHRLLYAVGGTSDESRLALVECYDPDSDEWCQVSGDGTSDESRLALVECYDPDSDEWCQVSGDGGTQMLIPRLINDCLTVGLPLMQP